MRHTVILTLCAITSIATTWAQWQAEVVSKFPAFGKSGEPVKVRFCPMDPSKVLAHIGQKECIIDVVKGTVTHFKQPGQLVDWIGDQLLMKNGDSYQLVQKDTLKASDVTSPAMAARSAPPMYEEPVLVGRGGKARIVRRSDNKTLMKAPFRKGIYGFQTNDDHSKWIIYYGDSNYMYYDALTKEKHKLPVTLDPITGTGISAWKFASDGSVIAEMGLPPLGVNPESEEAEVVARTNLFRYDFKTKMLEAIALPQELQNRALEVLDSGIHGHLFVAVSEQAERAKNHGAYVLKLMRPTSLDR